MGHTRPLSLPWAWLPTVTFPVSEIKYHDVSNLRKGLFGLMFKGAVPHGGEVMATGP